MARKTKGTGKNTKVEEVGVVEVVNTPETTVDSSVETTIPAEAVVRETKTSQIIGHYEAGLTLRQIAEGMGVRYQFVYNVCSNYCLRNGLELRKTGRRNTTGSGQRIAELLAEGKTVREIAAELKVSTNYVYTVRKSIVPVETSVESSVEEVE